MLEASAALSRAARVGLTLVRNSLAKPFHAENRGAFTPTLKTSQKTDPAFSVAMDKHRKRGNVSRRGISDSI